MRSWTAFSPSITRMDEAAENPRPDSLALRIVLRIVLICCGIGLFVAAGIVGGMLALHWLA